MNNEIFFAIPVGICILLAIYFLIGWFWTYSEIKRIDILTVIKEGMGGLSFINKEHPDFTKEEAKKLNRKRGLTYLFMLLGIATIILSQVLS
ncbi:MAG: hypothetical protein MI866_08020 [Bacteroidales bacterium]|nr:hypothetical protein [Bacteroidales bacterium]